MPRRSARSLICAADSSPETYSTGGAAAASAGGRRHPPAPFAGRDGLLHQRHERARAGAIGAGAGLGAGETAVLASVDGRVAHYLFSLLFSASRPLVPRFWISERRSVLRWVP